MVDGALAGGPYTLGIWDGHDSGAALLKGRQVRFAINEERLTRRKLEIRFPALSIQACLAAEGLNPSDIRRIAFSTTDMAKTLTRLVPSLKESYYRIRRRKERPGAGTLLKKRAKYALTRFGPLPGTGALSRWAVRRELRRLGFSDYALHTVDHHHAHAAGAYFSPFDDALVITLDGIGDGLSGTAYRLGGGRLERLETVAGDDSLGLFFEHVTNLMNMRELEDEGKVMALANFAYPVPDADNPMLALLRVDNGALRAACAPWAMYRRLKDILWQFPAEQFCYMAQRTLELRVQEWVLAMVRKTGLRRVVMSGGVASNIKANRLLRNAPEIADVFVFPHMGDGGQAVGAACAAAHAAPGVWDLQRLLLGPAYASGDMEAAAKAAGLTPEKPADIVEAVADALAQGEIVFWFQGRMELGPRALGARSILALPNSQAIKDDLNLKLKKRVWYQPFCPSMLEADARECLDDFAAGSPDRYMTSGYHVKAAYRERLVGVLNVDGTCRPQIVAPDDDSRFSRLLAAVKRRVGSGILLNTSMNIHGEPLVCSPTDAVRALNDSGARVMALGDWLVKKPVS